MSQTDYEAEALEAAVDALSHYEDSILELLVDEGWASQCISDYDDGDSYHHETHVDKSYGVEEAVKLLADLSEHEETDSGLWEGQDWERVLDAKAAYTYGNAVYWKFHELIGEINDEYELSVDDWEDEPSESERKEFAQEAFNVVKGYKCGELVKRARFFDVQ